MNFLAARQPEKISTPNDIRTAYFSGGNSVGDVGINQFCPAVGAQEKSLRHKYPPRCNSVQP